MLPLGIRVDAENDAYIAARLDLTQRSYTYVLNTELEWLRDFGFPWPRTQRIYAAAADQSATPYQYLPDHSANDLLKATLDRPDEHLAPVLRAPDDMVLARVDDVAPSLVARSRTPEGTGFPAAIMVMFERLDK